MFEQLPKKFIFRATADYSLNPDCWYGLGVHSDIHNIGHCPGIRYSYVSSCMCL